MGRVRVELQEQIGHLEAERTAQEGMKAKIFALEREMKGWTIFMHLEKLCSIRAQHLSSFHPSLGSQFQFSFPFSLFL